MDIRKLLKHPTASEYRRLRENPVFAFSEEKIPGDLPEGTEEGAPTLDVTLGGASEASDQATAPTASGREPQPTAPEMEAPTDIGRGRSVPTVQAAAWDIGACRRMLEDIQEQIKQIRREQEYLLNVTESSQAFLETLSRELISILQILGQNEGGKGAS